MVFFWIVSYMKGLILSRTILIVWFTWFCYQFAADISLTSQHFADMNLQYNWWNHGTLRRANASVCLLQYWFLMTLLRRSRSKLWGMLGGSRSPCCADSGRSDAGCHCDWCRLPEVGKCKRPREHHDFQRYGAFGSWGWMHLFAISSCGYVVSASVTSNHVPRIG